MITIFYSSLEDRLVHILEEKVKTNRRTYIGTISHEQFRALRVGWAF
jgi:hypothetical protein